MSNYLTDILRPISFFKVLISFILFQCLSIKCPAQSSLSFKIYQNTDFFKVQYTHYWTGIETRESRSNFSRISLAADWLTKKGYAHELELLIPEFSTPVEKIKFPFYYQFKDGVNVKGELTSSSFSVRYEVNKFLADNADRMDFLLGVGIHPNYLKLEQSHPSQWDIYSSLISYGFALYAIPRLYYKLNQAFSIDFNVPLSIYNLQLEKHRIDDPILPVRQQRFNRLNHSFFESIYTIRFGLRYSLSKVQLKELHETVCFDLTRLTKNTIEQIA